MAGLRRICKQFGGLITIANGKRTEYVWDYAKDEPVEAKAFSKEERAASERAKWEKIRTDLKKELDGGENSEYKSGS